MALPPRDPEEEILSRTFLLNVLFYAGLITASTLAAFLWGLSHAAPHATTMTFMTLGLSQIFHLGNARSRRAVVRVSAALSNRYAIGALIVSSALQIAPAYLPPLRAVLHTEPLLISEWVVVMVCSSVAAIVGQALRMRRRQ
jgi:Ca2+-transporting ATPase